MSTTTWEPGLGDHLRTIWRYRWFVLALAFAAGALTFAWRSTVDPIYDADASVRLTVLSDAGPTLDSNRTEYATRIYAELAESPRLVQAAVTNSGLDLTTRQADKLLDVEWARPPGFIDVSAEGGSADDAAALANGMALAVVDAIHTDAETFAFPDGDDPTTADDASPGVAARGGDQLLLSAEVVEAALPPSSPNSPEPVRDALVAFAIALFVLAEVVAWWRPVRGLLPLTRTAERVTDLVGVPCLTLTGAAEDRTRLALFAARHLSSKPAAVVVQAQGEPFPAAAVRLAEAVAIGGRRVLVVDGDTPEPVMHERLGLPRGPGLAEVFAGDRRLVDAVFASPIRSNMWLLTAGGRDDAVRAPVPSQGVLSALGVGREYDFVAVSLGSSAVPDGIAGAVAELPGSTILVIDPERTKRAELSELVHGFGGQGDVAAVLLITEMAAVAETERLATRWHRKSTNGSGPASAKSAVPSIRAAGRT